MAWGKNEDDEEALSGKFVLWRGGGGRTVRENEREMFLSSRRKKEMEIEKRAALFACLQCRGLTLCTADALGETALTVCVRQAARVCVLNYLADTSPSPQPVPLV